MDGEILKQIIGLPIAIFMLWALNPMTWIYYGIKWLKKCDCENCP